MFRSRSRQQELMDDLTLEGKLFFGALRELTIINTWLGGNRTSRVGVRRALAMIPHAGPVSILDVGAGGSDLVDALAGLPREVRITALDVSRPACEFSARRHPGAAIVQGSALRLPFREKSFDIVHAGMFLHHIPDEELHAIVSSLHAAARHVLVINDLRRSAFAYAGISVLTALLSRSAMVRHDAPLSVLRGFNREEIARIASLVPGRAFTLERTWAYRWLLCLRTT
jgi:2-polyprenyl-3-methyl-5-hydroxy-6-metoxy-1,4-benzoquinol methylase